MPDKKKSLRILPEVLPTPKVMPLHAASARQRTMAHLQKLVATAAAAGMTMACTREVPGQNNGANASSGATDDGNGNSGKTAGSSTATASAPTTTAVPTGYAVVDPLPAPVHCPDVAVLVAASAKFTKGDAGGIVAEITFPPPRRRPDVTYGKDGASYGWRVIGTEKRGDSVVVRAEVSPGSTYGSVTLPFQCDKGPGTLNANLTWSGAAKVGDSPAVRVTQY